MKQHALSVIAGAQKAKVTKHTHSKKVEKKPLSPQEAAFEAKLGLMVAGVRLAAGLKASGGRKLCMNK